MTAREKFTVYNKKPALRYLYKTWYGEIKENLAAGKTLEIGSGFGLAKKYFDCATSEYEKNEFVDRQEDALAMSFFDGSLDNIIGIDVLHHLNDLKKFFTEANRVLAKGGRLIFIEPYCSPFAILIRTLFHHERLDMKKIEKLSGNPDESNLAAPTILFTRFTPAEQAEYLKNFKIKKIELRDCLIYPLSGGYKKFSLMSDWLLGAGIFFERLIGRIF